MKKLSVLLVTGALLTACGGGGGGGTGQGGSINPWGGGGSTISSDNVVSIKKSELDKGFNGPYEAYSVYKVVLVDDNGETFEINRSNNLNDQSSYSYTNNVGYLLEDEDRKITVVGNGKGNASLVEAHLNGSIATFDPNSNNKNQKNDSSSTFGFAVNADDILDVNETLHWVAYSGGDITPFTDLSKISHIKEAVYEGKAIGADSRIAGTPGELVQEGHLDALAKTHSGKAVVKVNFLNKTMTGDLTFDSSQVSNVKLTGKVSGNQFAGTANNGKDSVNMQGQFNGTAAKELAGHYQSDKKDGMIGSFAGTRPTK